MQFDSMRFRGAIKMHTHKALAQRLGISQPALSKKLKDLDRLRFKDFYAICEAIELKPETFVIMNDNDETPARGMWCY